MASAAPLPASTLVSNRPRSASGGPRLEVSGGFGIPPPLQESDYTNVKFWNKQDWLHHRQKAKSDELPDAQTSASGVPRRGKSAQSQGVNVMMMFIEDANGVPVDGFRVQAIRAHAKAVWNTIAQAYAVPGKWGEATHEVLHFFYAAMYKAFEELRYCSNNWKACNIGTIDYPGWHKHYVNKQSAVPVRVKSEVVDSMDIHTDSTAIKAGSLHLSDSTSTHSKRSYSDPPLAEEPRGAKKPKTGTSTMLDDGQHGERQGTVRARPKHAAIEKVRAFCLAHYSHRDIDPLCRVSS